MDSFHKSLKNIQQNLESNNNNLIKCLKKAEKAFKKQDEKIKVLKSELRLYRTKDKGRKRRNSVKTGLLTSANDNIGDTTADIRSLKQQMSNHQQKIQVLAKENENIKKENILLKSKVFELQKRLPVKPSLLEGTNTTNKRSNPFTEVERRFSESKSAGKRRKISV
ncbi:hypothetical protein BD770DRAFT_38112 [Pilaira anomala]|nr:hypothetical protein BD770DRAFT_38112 [Pilaira anomala]